MAQIFPFPSQAAQLDQADTAANDDTEHGGGDGGGDIVIRLVIDWGDDDPESEQAEEPKARIWPWVVLGAALGLSI